MRSVIGVLSTLVLVAALGPGCGGGNACQDLVTAVDKASAAPGCAAPLAGAKSMAASIDVQGCDPAQAATYEHEAACFNAVENCEGGEQTLLTLEQCLKSTPTM